MEDLAGFLPDFIDLEGIQGVYNDAKSRWKQLKREALQQLHGSSTFRQTTHWKDEAMAHLRWSNRILQPNMVLPQPVEWDSRHLVALLELGRVLHDVSRNSSSDNVTTIGLPPVTSATCLALLLVFLKPGGVRLGDVSLSPYCVLQKQQYYRLFSAALVHVDATHLITNLTAALPDCVLLEEQQGSAGLALDVLLLTLASHALYVGFAWLQKEVFVRRYNYYSLVTVGFSGVVFALKVWAGCRRGGLVSIWGVPVPARFSWVPALALTHLCVPEASFPAHIAGVVAGLLRAYALEPVLYGLRRGWQCCYSLCSRSRWRAAGKGNTLQPAAAAAAGSGQLGGSWSSNTQQQQQQQADWRLQLHMRWLQQQEDAAGSSAEAGGGQQCRSNSSNAAAAAAGQASRQSSSSVNSSGSGRRWRVSAAVLEVGLQLGLAAAAAGLYFVLSSGERPGSSRLRASLWRR